MQEHGLRNIAGMNRSDFERFLSKDNQAHFIGRDQMLTKVLGGSTFLYLTSDDFGITPHLVTSGYWESWVTLAILRNVGPHANCIDVGANCGYYTMLLAAISDGFIQAWEPQDHLVHLITKSASVNGFPERVEVINLAASHESTMTKLCKPQGQTGLNITLMNHDEHGNAFCEVGDCGTSRIDELWPNEKRLDFVKIDAEGWEPFVILGMSGILARHDPIQILLEFCPARYEEPAAFWQHFAGEFQIQAVGLDGNLKEVTFEQCMEEPSKDDMLWLSR